MKTFIEIGGRLINLSRVLYIDGGRWDSNDKWVLNFHLDAASSKFDSSFEIKLFFDTEKEYDDTLYNLRTLTKVNF